MCQWMPWYQNPQCEAGLQPPIIFASQLTKDERIARFHTWMLHCGVDLESHGLSIINTGEEKGLGVVCGHDIAAGERVLSVPRKAMITGDDVTKSPLHAIVESMPVLQQMPMFALALFLIGQVHAANSADGPTGPASTAAQAAALQEGAPAAVEQPFTASRVVDSSSSTVRMELRGGTRQVLADIRSLKSGSKWRPYLAMLPRTLSCVLYWTAGDLQCLVEAGGAGPLQAFSAVRFIRSAVKHFIVLHSALITGLPSAQQQASAAGLTPSSFTWSAYRWALSVVMSRQNMVPSALHEGKNTLAFVPGWDLLNHEDSPDGKITTSFEGGSGSKHRAVVQSGTLHLTASRDFSSGEEVTMFYGRRPNRDLLQFSGFSLAANTWDAPLIEVPAPVDSDPLAKVRRLILNNLGLRVAVAVALPDSAAGAIVMPVLDVPPPPHTHGDSCGSACSHGHGHGHDEKEAAAVPVLSTCMRSYARVMACNKAQLGELLALGRGMKQVPPLSACLGTGGDEAETEARSILRQQLQAWCELHRASSSQASAQGGLSAKMLAFVGSQRAVVERVLAEL